MKNFSVCGNDCYACEHFVNKECSGCHTIKGKVWWTKLLSLTGCPVYDCVHQHETAEHCGQCVKIPCKLWYSLKDPSHSDEQHLLGIHRRKEVLKNL